MKDQSLLKEKVLKLAATAGITAHLGGECPCGKIFAVDMDQLAVAHSMPMCEDYEKREVDEYLHFVHIRYTN